MPLDRYEALYVDRKPKTWDPPKNYSLPNAKVARPPVSRFSIDTLRARFPKLRKIYQA